MWVSQETAKRSLGFYLKSVQFMQNVNKITIGGSERVPIAILRHLAPEETTDITISVDQARADWSAIMIAVTVFNTRFTIVNRHSKVQAILHHNAGYVHPALKYKRSENTLARKYADNLRLIVSDLDKVDKE